MLVRLWRWLILPWLIQFPNEHLADLINNLFWICVLWGVVNLLPIYPLDGGQIAREILLKFNPRDGIRQSLMLSILAAGAMALFGLYAAGLVRRDLLRLPGLRQLCHAGSLPMTVLVLRSENFANRSENFVDEVLKSFLITVKHTQRRA